MQVLEDFPMYEQVIELSKGCIYIHVYCCEREREMCLAGEMGWSLARDVDIGWLERSI